MQAPNDTKTVKSGSSRSRRVWISTAVLSAGLLMAAVASRAQTATPATAPAATAATVSAAPRPIDPEADRLFRAACQYLTNAKSFSFKAEVWEDVVLPSGQKIQTTKSLDVQESRPNRLRVEVRSPKFSRGFWYQDKALTMLDRANNLYGVMEVPDTIDKTIDSVEERFGIDIPLADVLVSDPYRNVMDVATSIEGLGKATVLGVVCHHIAITSETVDCQIWIADGAKPLPRKIVLNLKTQVGSPQVTAIYNDWDLVNPIADSVFVFSPPAGAHKIDVNPKQADEPVAPATTQPGK